MDDLAYVRAQLKKARQLFADQGEVAVRARGGGMALCFEAGPKAAPPPFLQQRKQPHAAPLLPPLEKQVVVVTKPVTGKPAPLKPIALPLIHEKKGAPQEKSKCVKEIEAMQARRERRRQEAKAAKESRAMDEDAAAAAGVGIDHVDFLRLLAEYRSAHGIGAAIQWPEDEDVWSARGASRICVVVRKRPMLQVEARHRDYDVVDMLAVSSEWAASRGMIVHEPKTRVDLTKAVERHEFGFDGCFSELDSNEQVFAATVRPLLSHVVSGGTATVFAFGQTGSGKTFLMTGDGSNTTANGNTEGLYALAARELMASAAELGLVAGVSFYEIYRGQVLDLLGDRRKLEVQEDGRGRVVVVGLSEDPVDSADAMMSLIKQAGSQRATGATSANDVSSRSHAILQVVLRDAESGAATGGRLHLCDLAGSERACDSTSCDRQTRLEGAEINKSLLALKECIRSLDSAEAVAHVPFRGSKLTHVLREAFVGNAKTCMIATVSPGAAATEHTLNTLRYAERVRAFSTKSKPPRGGAPSKAVPPPKPLAKPPAKRDAAARSPPASAPTSDATSNAADGYTDSLGLPKDRRSNIVPTRARPRTSSEGQPGSGPEGEGGDEGVGEDEREGWDLPVVASLCATKAW